MYFKLILFYRAGFFKEKPNPLCGSPVFCPKFLAELFRAGLGVFKHELVKILKEAVGVVGAGSRLGVVLDGE